MTYNISEKTIEDILSADKTILSEILGCNPSNLSLVARQKIVSTGKLDLLCLYEGNLVLVELKAVPFYSQIIKQINGYHKDLQELQKNNKLVNAPIEKIIVVTSCSASDVAQCQRESIKIITYKPERILAKYFENFKELSYFLTMQSGDYGVVRLGLLNTTLKLLSQGKAPEQIALYENKSIKTIRNRLSIATLVGLINKHKRDYFLTDMGALFVSAGHSSLGDRLTDEQSNILADFVKENPFYSQITNTILSYIETIFILAKSSYPVDKEKAQDFFIKSTGKEKTWKTPKARSTATYIFSNYACDLQFLSMVGNQFYITPKGIQSILLLQLNRSIKLIESQSQ